MIFKHSLQTLKMQMKITCAMFVQIIQEQSLDYNPLYMYVLSYTCLNKFGAPLKGY